LNCDLFDLCDVDDGMWMETELMPKNSPFIPNQKSE